MSNIPDNYRKVDKYRDFIRVFNGQSNAEEGRRVLTHILMWGGVSKGHWKKGMSTDELLVLEGQRNLALKILAALTPVQPTERETQQRRNNQ